MISPMSAPAYWAFHLHIAVELLAGYTFIYRPHTQLQPLPLQARLVLECYGGLLVFSAIIAALFCFREFDHTSRMAAAAFAFWHLWPSRRAVIRLQQPVPLGSALTSTLGGPKVHLATHAILFMGFGMAAIYG
jgi:hypothetical protein